MVINKLRNIDLRDRRTRGIILAAVGIILILIASILMLRNNDKNDDDQSGQANTTQKAASDPVTQTAVTWSFDQNKNAWVSSGKPPVCADPFKFTRSPVDTSKATSILYPGQSRGGNYKPHGGFRFDGLKPGDIAVTMPVKAILIGGSRYIESGEVQYLFDFQTECGIAFRFDHLLTLSPIFEDIANKFPEPEVDNTKGSFINPAVVFEAGQPVATAVGFSKSNNIGMDFGVYDYRAPNAASKNTVFAAAQKEFSGSAFYGVCWFDMLPAADAAQVKKLPAGDRASGKKSDYCK